MKVFLDSRLDCSSGIGRYITNIKTCWCANGFPFVNCPFGGGIYSIEEQFSFRRLKVAALLYWSPHYNAPIFASGSIFVTVHDVAHLALPAIFSRFQYLYARSMLSLVGLRAKHIFFVSHFSRDEFYQRLGIKPLFSSVIPCGVDSQFWGKRSAVINKTEKYFLAVGNIKPHKNLSGVLGAFNLLGQKNPDLRLKIVGKINGFRVGDDNFLNEINRTTSKVDLLEQVSDEELRALYQGAVGLVFPSFYEGFGLPPLEAMAAGCPSVVSRTGALPEICAAGMGIFCDPDRIESIAAGMKQLLDWTAGDRERWLAKTPMRLAQFSWEKSALAIWQVIQDHSAFEII